VILTLFYQVAGGENRACGKELVACRKNPQATNHKRLACRSHLKNRFSFGKGYKESDFCESSLEPQVLTMMAECL
jgi:hypothetical protein